MVSPLFKRKTFEETEKMDWVCKDDDRTLDDIIRDEIKWIEGIETQEAKMTYETLRDAAMKNNGIANPPPPPVCGLQVGDRVKVYGIATTDVVHGSEWSTFHGDVGEIISFPNFYTAQVGVDQAWGKDRQIIFAHPKQLRKLKKRGEIWLKIPGSRNGDIFYAMASTVKPPGPEWIRFLKAKP